MPARYTIDDDRKLITTTWHGPASEEELIEALSRYQVEIKLRPPYLFYDEILDFSGAGKFMLSAEGIRRLVEIAVRSDPQCVRTRLAIVVVSPVTYGLARMYQTYRGLMPGASKEVRIFRNGRDALEWIQRTNASSSEE